MKKFINFDKNLFLKLFLKVYSIEQSFKTKNGRKFPSSQGWFLGSHRLYGARPSVAILRPKTSADLLKISAELLKYLQFSYLRIV